LSDIRVLVVDDSSDVRKFVVQCVLEPNGFEALEATDGAEGVRKVLKGGIDLVLLDFEMPKMNGLQVLDALCARGSEVPVILITSHGSEAVAVEVFRKGVRDYVMKPFTADEMLAAMERALTEVRLQREKEALTARLVQTNRQLKKRLVELNTLSRIGKSVTIRGLFERYVALTVVEKLIAQPDAVALGGVRQRATILFADIRGFSSFSAHVAPEMLMNILNHHIAVAAEAILAERGTLDKFLGDAVMAYFNAPLPQPDHALRAVRAAWRICRAVDESHARLPSAHRLQFGVGVSTGEVLVGNTGAQQMMSYTVIGDAVNVSRRLQERARAGQILICQHIHELVRGFIEVRPLGMVELKGHSQPEPAFEVVAVRV
jgi:class 3 adenylate cyclase